MHKLESKNLKFTMLNGQVQAMHIGVERMCSVVPVTGGL